MHGETKHDSKYYLSYLSCRSLVIENFPLQEGADINNKVNKKYDGSISASVLHVKMKHSYHSTNLKLRKVWRTNKEIFLLFKGRLRETQTNLTCILLQ